MSIGLGQRVVVKVVITRGGKTEVHLDGDWQAPANASESQLVRAPNGFPIGWLACSQAEKRF